MAKITTFISFANEAEEAAKLYSSVFKNSKLGATSRYGKNQPMPEGTVMTIELEIEGQPFVLLNGGDWFRGKLAEGVSFQINCESQAEVDGYTDQLTAGGGEVGPCGWIKDRFGVSWQITPVQLMRLLKDKDPAKSNRVMQAMMQMKKIDIAELERAAAGS
jgi:predicted 3-demethylubiquinone-9 3-methyltransferase (glyoxalase superfamily)